METFAALTLLSFVGLSLAWWSDDVACVDKSEIRVDIGFPDDSLKLRFGCKGRGKSAMIASCSLNNVAVVRAPGRATITLASGNKYQLYCYNFLTPDFIQEGFAERICKDTAADNVKHRATIQVCESTIKLSLEFECEDSKIKKCFFPPGTPEGIPASDASAGAFGGKSGRKYIIICSETSSPYIREDYSAERCYSQTKFKDSITVSGSTGSINVDFRCADGKIAQCRPVKGKAMKPNEVTTFKQSGAEFKIACFDTRKPTIVAKSSPLFPEGAEMRVTVF